MIRISELTEGARALLSFSPLQYMFDFVAENPWAAEIYVDDERAPAFCTLVLGHYLFLGGPVDGERARELAERLYAPKRREQLGVVIVFYGEVETALSLKGAFPRVYDNERSLYAFAPANWRDLPTERVAPITEELLASGVGNMSMITDEVLGTATYRDMADFCRRGIGYTMIDGGAVRAFCTSEYPSAAALAIGIEVEEEYQRRGIASEMTTAFLRKARGRGLSVFWECWKRTSPRSLPPSSAALRRRPTTRCSSYPSEPDDMALSALRFLRGRLAFFVLFRAFQRAYMIRSSGPRPRASSRSRRGRCRISPAGANRARRSGRSSRDRVPCS